MLFVSYTAFVIIAPLIILYAIGYRPQVSSPIPRPVGVILADASPKRAIITVNDKEYGTLPRSVPDIEPGMARVEVEKDGYTPWGKTLEVKPTQATDIRSIRLVPAAIEKDTLASNIRLFAASPNNLIIAGTTTKNVLRIMDETGATLFPEEQLLDRPTALTWSHDGMYLLATFPKNTYQLFRITDKTITKVATKELTGTTNILWSPTTSNTLYGLDKNRAIVSYSISTGIKDIFVKNVSTYEISNRTIYYQTFQNKLISEQIRSRDPKTLIEDTGKIIKKISVNSDGTLALLFADGELRIQKTNGENVNISPVAENMSWSPDGQLLLVQTTPTELNVYNVENERLFAVPQGELRLVTRLSQPILQPQWFSDSLHIFYQTNNTILFSEIDSRDHAITVPLDTTKSSLPLAIGDQSESVLYIQQEGADTRLVQTWLLTKEDR